VLASTGDRDLKKLWIESLANHLNVLKRANAIVYTTLVALQHIDEPVFEENPSTCLVDYERNITEANHYLKRHGILVPG
jgi:hypothetical protein